MNPGIHASVLVRASLVADQARARVQCILNADAHDHGRQPIIQAALVNDLPSAIRPPSGLPMLASWLVVIGGVDVSKHVTSCSVERSRLAEATWTVELAMGAETPQLARPLQTLIASPCGIKLLPVDISLRYVSASSGRQWTFPLITFGVVSEHTEEVSRRGRVVTLQGLGPGGRDDGKRVTHRVPAGSMRTRDRIILDLLDAAQCTGQTAIPSLSPVARLVDPDDAALLDLVNAMLLPELLRIHYDRYGVRTATDIGQRVSASRLAVELTDAGSIRYNNSGPTTVVVESTIDVAVEAEEACSDRVSRTITTITKQYRPARAAWRQMGDGTLVAIPEPPEPYDPRRRVFQRTTYTAVERCGTLVLEETVTEGWHRGPITWRYELDTDGTRSGFNAAAFVWEATAVSEDENDAHRWDIERFGVLQIERRVHEFDDDGYGRRDLVTVAEWGFIETALKDRTPGIEWADTPYLVGLSVTGPGVGIVIGPFADGHFIDPARKVTIEREGDDGFVHSEIETSHSYGAAEGALFLWSQGARRDLTAELRPEQVTTRSWGFSGDSRVFTEVKSNLWTRATDALSVVEPGGLPAMPLLVSPVPPASAYGEDEDPSVAAAVLPGSSQTITVEVEVFAGDDCRQPAVQRTTLEWAENQDEIQRYAEHLARESKALTMSGSMPLHPLIDELSVLLVSGEITGGQTIEVHVEKVSWSGSAGGKMETTFEGKVYV